MKNLFSFVEMFFVNLEMFFVNKNIEKMNRKPESKKDEAHYEQIRILTKKITYGNCKKYSLGCMKRN
jgi:hypothetical protein